MTLSLCDEGTAVRRGPFSQDRGDDSPSRSLTVNEGGVKVAMPSPDSSEEESLASSLWIVLFAWTTRCRRAAGWVEDGAREAMVRGGGTAQRE